MPLPIFNGVRCVLLDIDGTLVDSNESHVTAWAEAFDRSGHAVERSAIRQQIGKGGDQLIPSLCPHLQEGEHEKIAEAHDEVFAKRLLPTIQPFDRAHDFVAALHAHGFKVVLASSAKRHEVDHYIRLLDIEKLIDALTCADDVENSKPAGDIFATALTKIEGVSADQALVIGDTPYDVIAASKCQIKTLALLSGGFSAETLREAGASEIQENVAVVLESLESQR